MTINTSDNFSALLVVKNLYELFAKAVSIRKVRNVVNLSPKEINIIS